MNASLNRREFAAGLGAIVVAFSLAPRLALAQEPPRLPGSLQTNRRLDAWLPGLMRPLARALPDFRSRLAAPEGWASPRAPA